MYRQGLNSAKGNREKVKMKNNTKRRNTKKKAEPKHIMITSMEGTQERYSKKGKNRNMDRCRKGSKT